MRACGWAVLRRGLHAGGLRAGPQAIALAWPRRDAATPCLHATAPMAPITRVLATQRRAHSRAKMHSGSSLPDAHTHTHTACVYCTGIAELAAVPRADYAPPDRPYAASASASGMGMAYMAPPRPMSADSYGRAGPSRLSVSGERHVKYSERVGAEHVRLCVLALPSAVGVSHACMPAGRAPINVGRAAPCLACSLNR